MTLTVDTTEQSRALGTNGAGNHALNPLARAVAMVQARDARTPPKTVRRLGKDDAATELEKLRAERTAQAERTGR